MQGPILKKVVEAASGRLYKAKEEQTRLTDLSPGSDSGLIRSRRGSQGTSHHQSKLMRWQTYWRERRHLLNLQ